MRRPNLSLNALFVALLAVVLIHFARPIAVSAQEQASPLGPPPSTVQVQARVLDPGPVLLLGELQQRLAHAAFVRAVLGPVGGSGSSGALEGGPGASMHDGAVVAWLDRGEPARPSAIPRITVGDLGH